MMFYGPSGAGKKTRIRALLREIYGSGVEKLKFSNKIFKAGSSRKKVEIATLQSNYHIEMCPADAGFSDTHVVSEVIKEIAQTHTLDPTSQKAYKVVVLNEVDRLSQQAQNALRRTMEKYMLTCRIIMCCESSCRVIEPLRSRCLGIRIPAPEKKAIVEVLNNVAKKAHFKLDNTMAYKVADACDRNLRRAILMLEATKAQQYPFADDQKVNLCDWELYVQDIAKAITTQQSAQRLLDIRGRFYEMLGNCIPADVIIKTLTKKLLTTLDDDLKYEVIELAAHFEHRIKMGKKPIYHLEAFVAKFMSIYKAFVIRIYS